jgi:hypothetical protein
MGAVIGKIVIEAGGQVVIYVKFPLVLVLTQIVSVLRSVPFPLYRGVRSCGPWG